MLLLLKVWNTIKLFKEFFSYESVRICKVNKLLYKRYVSIISGRGEENG